jgi:hypothetical protein
LNLGREEGGTGTPDGDWAAATGGRLSVRFDVEITSDKLLQEKWQEGAWTGGRSAYQLNVLEDPTYITSTGEKTLLTSDVGGWNVQLPRRAGEAGTLRLWFDVLQAEDLPTGLAAQRNDVTLAAGERLYLSTKCWRRTDWERGRKRMRPLQSAAAKAQQELEETLSHETGDRRLDGTNLADTVRASLDVAKLVAARDEKVRAVKEAEQMFPATDQQLLGRWPGSTEDLIVAEGAVTVKRHKLLGDEFHMVGRWKAVPVTVAVE